MSGIGGISGALVLLALFAVATVWRRKAEHDRRLREERQRFVAYSDRYADEWERMR